MSSSHRALTNFVVLYEIFEALYLWKGTLARLALCCRGFSDIALNFLWREMDFLTPLFDLLPCVRRVDGIYILERDIEDRDWARFDSYAKRVRRLDLYDDVFDDRAGNASVYFRIAQLKKGKPLLPSLRSFTRTRSLSSLHSDLWFLTRSLKEVRLCSSDTDSVDHAIGTFLLALANNVTELDTLVVQAKLPIGIHHYLDSIARHQGLQTLGLNHMGVPLAQLDALSSLEQLVTLDVELVDLPSAGAVVGQSISNKAHFPRLEYLTIKGDLSLIHSALKSFGLGCLKQLNIYSSWTRQVTRGRKPEDQSQLRWCFERLSSRSFNSLKEVTVTYEEPPPVEISQHYSETTTFSVVESLLSLRNLTDLSIYQYPCLPLSDEDVLRMATSWPNLRVLKLPHSTGPIQPTFSALHILSTWCPLLDRLEITVNTQGLPTSVDVQTSYHGLKILSVGDSFANNAPLVARHLIRLFPSLRSIRHTPGRNAAFWHQVSGYLSICHAVREDERKCIQG